MSSKRQRGESSKRSTKGAGRRQQDSNPHGIRFRDQVQEAKYNILAKRKIVPTRYLDEPTLTTLGLLDDVNWMFNNIGWGQFVHMRSNTYEGITLEFLSSLNANVLSGEGCDDGLITFRLLNTEHRLDLAQFNAIYGFRTGGERRIPAEFRAGAFWCELKPPTGPSYNPSSSKSSQLTNPCFRYAHRVMSNTLFGRGDSEGVVRQTELMFLWNMMHPEFNIDTGAFLVAHMSKVSNFMAGKIVIGGLITPIAEYLGHSIGHLPKVRGNDRLHLEACLAMKMIVWDGTTYRLVLPDTEDTYPLPDTPHTTVQLRQNWRFSAASIPEPMQQDHTEAQPAPHQPAPHQPAPHQPGYPTPEAFATLQAEVHAHGVQLSSIHDMVSAMYNWHIDQYPESFPPADPR